jgi:hypothetical protein
MTDKHAILNSAGLMRAKGYGVELAGNRILLAFDAEQLGCRSALVAVLAVAKTDGEDVAFSLLMKILGDAEIGEFCRHTTLEIHTWKNSSECEVVELTPEDFFALHLNQQGRFR